MMATPVNTTAPPVSTAGAGRSPRSKILETIVTTGKTDEEAYELLIAMGLPIRQKKKKIEESAEDTVTGIENTPPEIHDEDKADETPIDAVEMASDVGDNKEETSELLRNRRKHSYDYYTNLVQPIK